MSTDLDHLDDGEEAQVAWLLESGHDAPQMPREFVTALSRLLDSEFTKLHSNGFHAAPAALSLNGPMNGSLNGSAHHAVVKNEPVEVAPERDAADKSCGATRPRRRWIISVVAAASVALAAAILTNP